MDILNVPFGWLLNLSYKITGNYVFALLVFALIIKVVLLPFGIMQHKNSLKQASLRPREAAIIKKYAGRNDRVTMQKKQEEIQRLYQSENYSQFAGCLPMLLQLPIIISIFNVIKNPLRYLCGLKADTVNVIIQHARNITGNQTLDPIGAMNVFGERRGDFLGLAQITENIADVKLPDFGFFGVDLSQTPRFGVDILILVPLITFVAVFFSTKLTKKFSYQSPQMAQNSPDVKMSMGLIEIVMPLMSTFITFGVPAAIGIYWIYQNLLGVLQQFLMVKAKPFPVFTAEDYKEAERVMAGKSNKKKKKLVKDPDRPRVRSLHHIDDDEYNAKVVENTPNKADGGAKSDLISPVPMKDYSNKKNKS